MTKLKFKNALRFFCIVVSALVISAMMFVACTKKTKPSQQTKPNTPAQQEEMTKDLILPNSDFKVTEAKDNKYPANIKSWSKKNIRGNIESKINAGAIETAPEKYKEHSKSWGDEKGDNSELYSKIKSNSNLPSKLAMIHTPKVKKEDDSKYEGASAYSLSNEFELEGGYLYKFSIDVMTDQLEGYEETNDYYKEKVKKPGAWLSLTNSTRSTFRHINTNGTWKTYTFYMQAPSSDAKSKLKFEMSLGNLDRPSSFEKGYLTSGYAFFGNLKIEKIAKDKMSQVMNEAKASDKEVTRITDLRFLNGDFKHYNDTYISQGSAPDFFTTRRGTDKNDPNPPDVSARNLVMDSDKFIQRWDNFGNDFYSPAGPTGVLRKNSAQFSELYKANDIVKNMPSGVDGRYYIMSQSLMSAQELQTKNKIVLEPHKKYRISMWLYTYNIHGAGVDLVLRGANTKDIVIRGISKNQSKFDTVKEGYLDPGRDPFATDGRSNGGWKEYIFEIESNLSYSQEYTLGVALGSGGPKANKAIKYNHFTNDGKIAEKTLYNGNGTFSSGYAFVAGMKFETIDSLSIAPNATEDTITGNYYVDGDDKQKIAVRLENTNTNTNTNHSDNFSYNLDVDNKFAKGTEGIPGGWKLKEPKNENDDYLIQPSWAKAGLVDLKNPTYNDELKKQLGDTKLPELPFDTPNNKVMMLSMKNNQSSLFMDTKDGFELNPLSSTRVSFYMHTALADKNLKNAYVQLISKDENGKEKVLSTFSDFKTHDKNNFYNNWREISMYINNTSRKKLKYYLRVSLGKADKRFAHADSALGTMFFTQPTFTDISENVYSIVSASGDAIKKYEDKSSVREQISNTSFNQFDNKNGRADIDENGHLKNGTADPKGWEISDKTLKDPNLVNGVVEYERDSSTYPGTNPAVNRFKKGHNIDNVFGADSNLFDKPYADEDLDTNPKYSDSYTYDVDKYGYNGPNMLAMGSKNHSKFSFGYTSSKKTLDANSFYEITVYAKSVKNANFSMYITNSSGVTPIGPSKKLLVQKGTTQMTAYKFYIRTGVDSVTMQLNFWLGYNEKKFSADDIGDSSISPKSSGYALFDHVSLNKIDEKSFNDAPIDAKTAKLELSRSNFDITDVDPSKRNELKNPTDWTTEADDTKKSSTGLLTSNDAELDKKEDVEDTEIDESKYFKSFGKEKYTDDKFKPTQDELVDAKSDYPNLSDTEISKILSIKKYTAYIKKHWLEATSDNVRTSNSNNNSNFTIYNSEETTTVVKKKNFKLEKESTYKISITLRTKIVRNETDTDEDFKKRGAYLKMKFNSNDNSPVEFEAIQTETYKTYTFYLRTQNTDVSQVSLMMSLGRQNAKKEDNIAQRTAGWAFIDTVSIQKVSNEEFDESKNNEYTISRKLNDKAEKGSKDKTPDVNSNKPKARFNTEMLWWMIPTIILGVLIIVVLVIAIYNKVHKKTGKGFMEYMRDDISDSALEDKHKLYESFDDDSPGSTDTK